MKYLPVKGRTIAVVLALVPLFALFVYVALHSGPLAEVPVTLATVENRAISPSLFGIGTVESRYNYKIGPTSAGRLKRLDVDVGDRVEGGQLLGEMDPLDLHEKIRAQEAAVKRAEALLSEAEARQAFTKSQFWRYERLLKARSTSEEIVATKKQEELIAEASLGAAREDAVRLRSEQEALVAQLNNLKLVAPAPGLVAARNADPGTTVVAGQAVVELIDPLSLWVNVRFDQGHAHGLAAMLPAQIVLRTQEGGLTGRVLWIEPVADVVTEEMLVKVVFEQMPVPLPAVGELAEVTVTLPPLPAGPVIPNAAIQRVQGKLGVWQIADEKPRFSALTLGTADLDGHVQVRQGLDAGDQVVVYSTKALTPRSRVKVVEKIPGVVQ